MNTNATQPTNLDKRLKELAENPNPLKDDIAGLAASLLRARVVLATCADYENCVCHEPCPDENGVRCLGGLLVEALADTELEELLR